MQTRTVLSLTSLGLLLLLNCGKSPTGVDPLGGAVIVMESDWTGTVHPDVWLRDSTGQLVDLTKGQPWFDGWPQWSPNGQLIAFTSDRDTFVSHVFVMNPDGSGVTQLTDGPSAWASWSPDGTRLVYQVDVDLWVMNADGSSPSRLTYGGTANQAHWSPDGQRIAFSCGVGTNPTNREICVINADGSDTVNLTNDSYNDYAPRWSPDGQQIVFYSDRQAGQRPEVYVMNADGSSQTRLTYIHRTAYFPIWSPDGQSILFAAGTYGSMNLYLMNSDGTNQRIVPNTPGAATVSWRP